MSNTDADLPMRLMEKPVELKAMFAWRSECDFCTDSRGEPGIVKMGRDQQTLKLQPDKCRCLLCGQAYYLKMEESLEDFEARQWKQKGWVS